MSFMRFLIPLLGTFRVQGSLETHLSTYVKFFLLFVIMSSSSWWDLFMLVCRLCLSFVLANRDSLAPVGNVLCKMCCGWFFHLLVGPQSPCP